MTAPDFFEGLALADSAAQKFVGTYPSREESAKWRDYLRSFCVPGLRWLWRNGNADARALIATRIAVWHGKPTEEVRQINDRVRSREAARIGGAR